MQNIIAEPRKAVAFYRIRPSIKEKVEALAEKLNASEAEVVDALLSKSFDNIEKQENIKLKAKAKRQEKKIKTKTSEKNLEGDPIEERAV